MTPFDESLVWSLDRERRLRLKRDHRRAGRRSDGHPTRPLPARPDLDR